MNRRDRILKMVLAGLFLALAYVLPFLTGQIPEIGSMLCPMHIPVLLCGFICGWPWGLAVGVVAPLFRSLLLGMPPLFPQALAMAVELAVYGAASGLLRRYLPRSPLCLYGSLLLSMLLGRLAWGGAMLLLLGVSGGQFSLALFLSGAFTGAIPGILIQLVLIPPLVALAEKGMGRIGTNDRKISEKIGKNSEKIEKN